MTDTDETRPAAPGVRPLDVRSLEPRERHPLIFQQLDGLGAGETVRLINDHDPVPLRYQLEAERPDQFSWTTVEAGPERWIVDIAHGVRTVDARPIIAGGGEPFATIMEAASNTAADESLLVYAPFDPEPLKAALIEKGFGAVTEQVTDTTWRVTFNHR
ncbi:MAG: DUF2249 domain-containing protein [Acidimicrobiia bacterium]|nr:DUF2249 domain-containing protein [Acidimicrobiia bacterium]